MAIRFAQAGCRVAAVYPSKGHLLACTRAVSSHHHLGLIDPMESLFNAMRESGAELVIPCDGMTVRNLHTLYGGLPATDEGSAAARAIERSLGDSTAFLLIDSRHEIQTAARAAGLNAVESFAIGMATDPETLAQAVAFPWELKTDYSWGGRDERIVKNLAEAREFIRLVGTPPSLTMAVKQIVVNADRAALSEWMHARRSGLSAQRPVPGVRAMMAVSCWRGGVLASIAAEAISPGEASRPPAVVKLIQNEEMERTARRIAERLGLSGFHSFDFIADSETGGASLTGMNSHCIGLSHLNAGSGHDVVNAFLSRWLGKEPAVQAKALEGNVVACFPRAWAANPNDPILKTSAYDVPSEEPELVEREQKLVGRDRRYLAWRSRVQALLGFGRER